VILTVSFVLGGFSRPHFGHLPWIFLDFTGKSQDLAEEKKKEKKKVQYNGPMFSPALP